uniref:Uncharacterized protein n=1 Tax=Lygus hesperus TaxID=30085 RepID=A0A0A9Z5T3_LYGHE
MNLKLTHQTLVNDLMETGNRLEDEIDGIVREVKKFYQTQSSLVTQEIDAFRANSEYQTQRSLDLEAETNLLMSTSFKDTVSGDIYLETLALVEVLYNYVLGPSNSKFEGPEMMLQIEEELRDVDIMIKEMGKAQYRIYEKKVERRMKKEMKEALMAKKQDRMVRGAIARVRKMYLRPPYGPGWRKVVPRSPPLIRHVKIPRPELVKRKESKKFQKHLQLEGICDRDDVEAEIDELLHSYTRRKPKDKDTPEEDSVVEERSSLRSSVSTEAILQAIQLFESQEEEENSEKSLSLIQLGYDSEEELLRKNYEKRKRRGEDIPEPDVLYEIRSIDSKFMVSPKEKEPQMKDKRHVHRPEPRLRHTNALSWR